MSKWKERIPGIVISVILVAVFAVFMVILLQSKMVPTKLLILGGIALSFWWLLLFCWCAASEIKVSSSAARRFLWCWRWCLVLRATTFRSRPAR